MNEISTNWVSIMPFTVTLCVATVGWLFTYFHARYQSQKQAQLELVNKKLRLFYGPLYARLLAGNEAWFAFTSTKWPQHGQDGYFSEGHELSNEELKVWRHWMKHVFHPMNHKLESIIVEHLDLVEENEIPAALTSALTHIYVYEAVLKAWDLGDFSEHTSIAKFPAQELLNIVEPTYLKLRERQASLSGTRNK